MRTKTKQTHNPSETTKVVLENPDVRVVNQSRNRSGINSRSTIADRTTTENIVLKKPKKENQGLKFWMRKKISDPVLINNLWSIYSSNFSQNDKSALQQYCFTKTEFIQLLGSTKYITFVVENNGEIVGFGSASTTITGAKSSFINPLFYKKTIKSFPKNKLFYFTILCINRGGDISNIKFLLEKMIEYCISKNGFVAFDNSENNSKYLFKIISRIACNQNKFIKSKILDRQVSFCLWTDI